MNSSSSDLDRLDRLEYEELLAKYSHHESALELLKQYRPYLEMIPSMRRSEESVISIPLPVVKLRKVLLEGYSDRLSPIERTSQTVMLPCDLAYLMCEPEWKIKMGGEIFIFIQRPEEDLSDLLTRWRQTQIILGHEYEWIMPQYYRHIISEGSTNLYPLFVLFERTAARIKQGLIGAHLPWTIASIVTEPVSKLTPPDRQIWTVEEPASESKDS
jgi:hypothetical protein